MLMQDFLRPLLLCSLLAHALLGASQNPNLYFPPKTGTAWQTLAPASLGVCPERVDSLYTFLAERNTKSFMLLQDGRIVLEKYFGTYTQDSIWYWASAGKSLTAFLVGQAQEEGLLKITDPSAKYLGAGWTSATPAQEATITVRHQLDMTTGLNDAVPDDNCTTPACLKYLAAPGTRWAYHNAPYRLIHDVVAKASGLNINQFTQSRVFSKVGMKGFWFDHIQYGRARDMARFGLLMLADGIWDGDTLLHDAAYFQAMTQPSQQLNKSYGYLWWLNGQQSFMLPGVQLVIPGQIFSNAPADLYAALGKNDQKIHIVPSKGWVVVRQGDAAGYVGPGGGQVPIVFDNEMWKRINQLICSPVSAPEVVAGPLRISPNPASEGWRVQLDGPVERAELYDLRGTLLRSVSGDSSAEVWLDGTGLAAGIFTLKVWSAGKVMWGRAVRQ
jgi:CubicO group peptidase (beta-lactamase class C family)